MEYQVVIPVSVQPDFEQWLRARGWYLFSIPPTPGVDDLPTFGIAPTWVDARTPTQGKSGKGGK